MDCCKFTGPNLDSSPAEPTGKWHPNPTFNPMTSVALHMVRFLSRLFISSLSFHQFSVCFLKTSNRIAQMCDQNAIWTAILTMLDETLI